MSLRYITKLNENVHRDHVSFLNRYGIKIAVDLYSPKERTAGKYPALIVGAPYGG